MGILFQEIVGQFEMLFCQVELTGGENSFFGKSVLIKIIKMKIRRVLECLILCFC